MLNLKNKKQGYLESILQEKYLVVFLAFVLVMAINQVVFTYILKERERAKAFTSITGTSLFSIPPGTAINNNVKAGTNMQFLADFWLPTAWLNNSLTCSFWLGNACIPMVEADGAATIGPGVDDEGAAGSPFNLVPYGGNYVNIFFNWTEWVCADSCVAPVEDIYKDGNGDCVPGNGGVDVIVLDNSANGLVAGAYTNVGLAPSWGYCGWVHSELVNNNGAWDYCDPAITPGCGSAQTETVWALNLQADTVLAEGSDWNNPVAGQWQSDVFAAWVGNERFYDADGDGKFGGIGVWAKGMAGDEPAIIDLDNDNLYEDGPDTLYDADGSGSASIGTNDDVIADGSTLIQITPADRLCWNGANIGSSGTQIMYVDGNGNCTPGDGGVDTIIRDDTGGGLPLPGGLGTFPYTFFPATALSYFDADASTTWTWGANAAATESLWLGLQGLNQWHSNIEGAPGAMLDADGTATPLPGVNDDPVSRGLPLTYLTPADNVCISIFPPAGIEDVYIDQTGDCIPSNDPACAGGMPCAHPNILIDVSGDGLNPLTTYDPPLGQWASAAFSVSYFDHLAPFGSYNWGAGTLVTESIWQEWWGLNYTSTADIDVYSTGASMAGDSLVIGTGPSGQPLGYVDTDNSGTLTATDTILEDNGNVESGPAGVPNGVVDRQSDYLDSVMFTNAGTALAGSDISNLYACTAGADLWCGTGDLGETCSIIPYQSIENAWFNPSSAPVTGQFKICLFADISPFATPGRTIQIQIPQLVDTGPTPGLYDVGFGEKGIFNYSSNDGPTDAPITAPYTFTITAAPSYGGGVRDTTPPTIVSNLQITADYTGKVIIIWQDPVDSDLSQIIIDELYQNKSTSATVNPGVQSLVLTGRLVNETYKYIIYTKDTSGNQSASIELTVTIPSQGQVTVVPEIPTPITPLPSPEITLPAGINIGDLLKNPTKTTVYVIGNDKKRHVFPNEATFFTWFADFSKVKTVDDAILSQIPLDSNVTVRPGTKLVKIQTDPKVYAVEPGGIIRPIASATIAANLYGFNWANRVIDVPDVFFVDYSLGSVITEVIYPSGSLIQYAGSTEIYYIEGKQKRLVPSSIFSYNQFMIGYVNKNVSPTMFFEIGETLPQMTIIDQMHLK